MKAGCLIGLWAVAAIFACGLLPLACGGSDAAPGATEGSTACKSDSDCNISIGEMCSDGVCLKSAESRTPCTTSLQCDVGLACVNGFCDTPAANTATGTLPDGDVPDSPVDGDGADGACPTERFCTAMVDCFRAGFADYDCVNDCCMPVGGDTETEAAETEAAETDGDTGTDGDQPTGCAAAGCPAGDVCNEQTGECEPASDCRETGGCARGFVCNPANGRCEAGECNKDEDCGGALWYCDVPNKACVEKPEHCVNAPCRANYDCNRETGLCAPGAGHCLNAPCGAHFTCNNDTGVCDAGPDHCSRTPCSAHFACNQSTGECAPDTTHCATAGCDDNFSCNQTSGVCEPGTTHCSVTPCTGSGYVCQTDTGRCRPPATSCQGNCSGNADQFCIDSGPFLCECDSNSKTIVDCEQYCYDLGYPIFDSCDYYRDSQTPSNSRWKCMCDNYGMSDGNCGSPVLITRLPYIHTWEFLGAGAALSAAGCTWAQGGSAPSLGGYERVYRFDAADTGPYRFDLTNEVPIMANPFVTIRNQCGNTFTWCQAAQGTSMGGGEDFTVTLPAAGTYYITVEDDQWAGAYTLNISR